MGCPMAHGQPGNIDTRDIIRTEQITFGSMCMYLHTHISVQSQSVKKVAMDLKESRKRYMEVSEGGKGGGKYCNYIIISKKEKKE